MKGKSSLNASQVAFSARAYSCFCSMKRMQVLLLPLNEMVVLVTALPTPLGSLPVCYYPFLHQGGERHLSNKGSCPWKQLSDPVRPCTQTSPSQDTALPTPLGSLPVCYYPFLHQGGERHLSNKGSCPWKQLSDPVRPCTQTSPSQDQGVTIGLAYLL